jgi:hypothetical protein
MTKVTSAFRDYAKAPKIRNSYQHIRKVGKLKNVFTENELSKPLTQF